MIEQNSIENLKSRLDIVEVVGSYIELKKSGANYKARCPFHSEDTPSFVVSPSKQIYHCFGCGAGGDAISFVMDYDKLSYPEAIEKLASDFNVPLSYTKGSFEKKDDRRVLEQTNQFYKRNLFSNQKAKEYIEQRGIYASSVEKFELGYAPSSAESIRFLKENMLSMEDALKTGIIGKDERGSIYARLIERITFPIYAPNGKIVGFGGRTISNHPAKYINSPQTYLFNKSKLLYGYNLARDTINKKGRIIITEGYLDVIMLHQAGFSECVATLGTALTSDHLPLLRRGEPKVILSYDGDKAGIEAAFKAAKMLSASSIDGGVVMFGGGKDPADMVKDGDIGALKSLFNEPKPFAYFVMEHIASKYDLHNPIEKEKALKEGIEFLKTLSPVLQDSYKSYLSTVLNVDKRVIHLQNKRRQTQPSIHHKEDLAELVIIKTLLVKPEFFDMVLDSIGEEVFRVHRDLFVKLLRGDDKRGFEGLLVREDINELDEEELKKQLRLLLLGYYKIKLDNIKSLNLPFDKKSFYIRKIQDKIYRLKRGEIVEYEEI
jgi:DNA primase